MVVIISFLLRQKEIKNNLCAYYLLHCDLNDITSQEILLFIHYLYFPYFDIRSFWSTLSLSNKDLFGTKIIFFLPYTQPQQFEFSLISYSERDTKIHVLGNYLTPLKYSQFRGFSLKSLLVINMSICSQWLSIQTQGQSDGNCNLLLQQFYTDH